jgi:hypothetical protein
VTHLRQGFGGQVGGQAGDRRQGRAVCEPPWNYEVEGVEGGKEVEKVLKAFTFDFQL